jgi:hypothetical protein
MSLEELKRKFILEQDVLKSRLEAVVEKALPYCVTDQGGQVRLTARGLSAKDEVMLVLAARAIASQLDLGISAEVNVAEIAKYAGLPDNQVRARGNELIKGKLAESTKPGVYKAVAHKVEGFLDSLARGASAPAASRP